MRPTTGTITRHEHWLPLSITWFASLFMPRLTWAHHDMDGDTPMTLAQGLVSGLAHPLIGLDHLAVLLLLGALCGTLKARRWPVLGFVAMSIVGCVLHASGVALPLAELSLALSVVAAGMLSQVSVRRGRHGLLTMFSLFGVLHGYAYGDSIIGAGRAPLVGYIAGFALIQFACLGAAAELASRARQQGPARPRFDLVRLLSLACLCVGATAVYLAAA